MTPEQRALRDAFLAECWAPVREYHPPIDPRELRAQAGEKPREKRSIERQSA